MIIYDGVDLEKYFRIAYDDCLAPPVQIESLKVPGRNGELFRSSRLGTRSINMRLRLKLRRYQDVAEHRRHLAGLLIKDRPCKLVLGGDPDRYYMAIVEGESELDSLWYTGGAEVTFVCHDPLAYGAMRTRPFASIATGKYAGTYKTAPIFEATPLAGSTYYRVTNSLTGEFVQVTHNFDGKTPVLIDCGLQLAKVGGSPTKVAFASDYFYLEPGEYSIGASAPTTMKWQEVWL